MNISVEKLLHKIEEELKEAKGTNSNAKIRERVHAIKTMCELILEESTTVTSSTTTTQLRQIMHPIWSFQIQLIGDK